jgi:cytochrome c oxidase subunit 2
MNELYRALLFLPPQRSTFAADVDALHYVVITATMLGATAVTIVGGWFLIRYRRGRPGGRARGQSRPPVWMEATVVVVLLGMFVAFWLVGARQYDRMRVAPEGAMEVWVTAKQWMWTFTHADGSHSIATLYVPAHRPVKLVMTSRDMIHSFYVPEFRIKQDVIPGRYTTVWFEANAPGTYPILCAEYCGAGHSVMRGDVVALEPADYERWLAGPKPGGTRVAPQPYVAPATVGDVAAQPLDLARQGERVAAEQGCLRCHTVDGTPFVGPTWAGLYRSTVPLADGSSVVADDAYLTESMMDPLARVVAGYQPVMPTYLGRLRPAEVAAIVELIRSLADAPAEGGTDTGAPPPRRPTP